MIRLNTSTRRMSRREISRIITLTMNWCKRNLGVNKRKQYELQIRVLKNTECETECGQYLPETNEIELYWNNLLTIKEVVDTCIHEWTHYRQPILTKYHKWTGSYSKNPYEVEARKAEKKYTPICWDEIKHKVNKMK